jgi:hypothetical protein
MNKNYKRQISEILPIIIELNDEEMDWLDEGNGFCALGNLPKKDYDDASYAITLKLRESYSQVKLKNENRYALTLTKKEIDYIYDIMVDLLVDFEYSEIVEQIEDIPPEIREENMNDFKGTLALTNAIFKKMGKPLQTFETLEKYLKELNSLEDNE